MGIKRPSASTQIIIALVLGVSWSYFTKDNLPLSEWSTHWIAPLGKLFIKLLYFVAIPLIFSSLITGMGSLQSISELRILGRNTLLIFLSTGAIATSLGVGLAYFINPGKNLSTSTQSAELQEKVNALQQSASESQTISEHLYQLFPDNFAYSFTDNKQLLQVVLIAFILGIALTKLQPSLKALILQGIDAIQQWFTVLIHMIMTLAPIGVFGLTACLTINTQTLISLTEYIVTVLLGLAILLFVVYPLFFTTLGKTSYFKFFKESKSVLLMAFSTSSSNATLPLTLDLVKNKFKVPEHISNFVVSLGTTVNMDGTALYQSVAAYFIAQSLGIELSFIQMLTIVVTAVISAIGAAGVPGAGMLTLIIILQSVGIPVEGIVLILAPDRLLDMFRTVINVAGDISTSLCVQGLNTSRKS